jgi:hypothetical protein
MKTLAMLYGPCCRVDGCNSNYEYRPNGLLDFAGITFFYPENLVAGATLLANGPYHVWKNRLKGTLYFRFGE